MALFVALSAAAHELPEHEAYTSDYAKHELSAFASAYANPEHLAYASAYSKPVDYYVSWIGTYANTYRPRFLKLWVLYFIMQNNLSYLILFT